MLFCIFTRCPLKFHNSCFIFTSYCLVSSRHYFIVTALFYLSNCLMPTAFNGSSFSGFCCSFFSLFKELSEITERRGSPVGQTNCLQLICQSYHSLIGRFSDHYRYSVYQHKPFQQAGQRLFARSESLDLGNPANAGL